MSPRLWLGLAFLAVFSQLSRGAMVAENKCKCTGDIASKLATFAGQGYDGKLTTVNSCSDGVCSFNAVAGDNRENACFAYVPRGLVIEYTIQNVRNGSNGSQYKIIRGIGAIRGCLNIKKEQHGDEWKNDGKSIASLIKMFFCDTDNCNDMSYSGVSATTASFALALLALIIPNL